MNKRLIPLFLGALLCALLVLPAQAEEFGGSPVTIWGVIVDTDFGLVINDGYTDYLLLGVDDTQLEGKTCEVTGTATKALGIDAISVESIEIIGDASTSNYSTNLKPGQSPQDRRRA